MKQKLSITLDEETIRRISEQIISGKFRNKSHLVEFSIKKFLEEQNG